MTRGLAPRQLRRLMKQMGMSITEVKDVEYAIIKTKDAEYFFEAPTVSIIKLKDLEQWQIVGTPVRREMEEELEIDEEDIRLIVEQTGCSRDSAINALKKAKGDLAEAILIIQGGGLD